MLEIEKALWSEAEHISLQMQRRTQAIKARLDEIESQKAAIQAELETADRALQRVVNFQPRIGGNFQCPRCWIRDEARFTIRPIPSPDDNDLLRCDRCGNDWVLPYR